MSETATETATTEVPEAATAAETTATTETAPETADLGDAGKKAIAAERAARKAAERSAAELLAKVQAFEDADKSETEKAAARAEAAERRAIEAEAKVTRAEVADELNVPKELRKFLTGTTEDDLREQATELLTAFNAATASIRTTPRPDPTQGAKPTGANGGAPLQLTAADAERMSAEQIVAAKAAGQFNDLLGIKS
jgi:hypothetical protein